ncbi:MAG: hypothetical protein KGI50_06070, partial [Patescibacteria group bacterium]|nr:hypothetical protein [Patescibacteria group bacterium]
FIYAGLCRSLNASAKFYSDVFTDGIIQLRFEPQTTRKSGKVVNEFQVRVFNTQGGENQNDQSRGEEQLAALMCVLCLRDVGPKSNLLILDEPVEGLDVENSISFARGLKKISDRIPTIFLATHNEYVKSEFRSANTIKIIKEKRISRIEEN